jgi:hypothetical protein
MAAVPLFTSPSAPAWPVSPGPSRPTATVLRFPRPRRLTPVAPDRCEGRSFVRPGMETPEIAAAWLVFLALALVGALL